MIKTVLLGLLALVALALAVVCLLALRQPDEFRIERRLGIQAPPEKLHALIADLRTFNRWNPYAKKDPTMTTTYRGPTVGVGAAFDFAGNGNAGAGSLEITGDTPTAVDMRLRMRKPMDADNAVRFSLTPRGDITEVSWAMQGRNAFPAKVMGVIFDIDQMVGRDFEAGLHDLKILAEQR